MTAWMVRAGRNGENEDFALEKGLAVIGWDELDDLSGVASFEEMKGVCEKAYPDSKPMRISNFAGQLSIFVLRIGIGDLVVLPLKTRSAVAVGRATGPYRYEPDFPDGARHVRAVEWIRKDIPRTDLDQDLLLVLQAAMTVCQIRRENVDARLQALASGQGLSDDAPEPLLDLEAYANDQIRSHINMRFKTHDLTRLVTAVLKAQGYQTYMSPPGPDGGVDIVAGRGPMGFDPPKLCVQVKSGSSPVDVSTLRELQGVMKNVGAQQGLLVSWGGFRISVYRESRTLFFEIRLWDADGLVQAILDSYDSLADEIQAELPLKRVWTLVPEE